MQTTVSNVNIGDDLPVACSFQLSRIAAKHKIPIVRSTVNWGDVAVAFFQHHTREKKASTEIEHEGPGNRPNAIATPGTSSSISETPVAVLDMSPSASASGPSPSSTPETLATTSTNHKLTAEEKSKVENVYKKLDQKKMWKLSTGTLVEKQMEKLAKVSNYEHPCHSLILDPHDPSWKEYFSAEEILEMKNYKDPQIIPLPDACTEYLEKYENLKTLDEVRDVNLKHNFQCNIESK